MDEAMQQVADQWLNRAEAALGDISPRLTTDSAVADAVLRVVTASGPTYRGDADLLVMYERYLEAGRQPRLRQMVARYDRQLDRLVQQVLSRADLPADLATARHVLAQMDGVTLRALAENRPVRPSPGRASTPSHPPTQQPTDVAARCNAPAEPTASSTARTRPTRR